MSRQKDFQTAAGVFVGDEPDEYVNQAENNTIISFNTVCNLDPTILAYFYAGCRAQIRQNGGRLGRRILGKKNFRKKEF